MPADLMSDRSKNTSAKILLLESDDATRDLICATLSDAGFSVATVYPQLGRAADIALVIVDLGHPKQAGAGAIAALRRRFSQARLLAVSGRFDVNPGTSPSVALQLGADRVLAKPLDLRALVSNVKQMLSAA